MISIHALREEGDERTAATLPPFQYFYPRPPRGGRHRTYISINIYGKFLSTPSARRATGYALPAAGGDRISIHALREEGDGDSPLPLIFIGDFYPRPPRGGRLVRRRINAMLIIFLSTPSARRATSCVSYALAVIVISIHALREEGDELRSSGRSPQTNFYPRPPRGGRPARRFPQRPDAAISIHALREEGDMGGQSAPIMQGLFLSTPSARRATGQN